MSARVFPSIRSASHRGLTKLVAAASLLAVSCSSSPSGVPTTTVEAPATVPAGPLAGLCDQLRAGKAMLGLWESEYHATYTRGGFARAAFAATSADCVDQLQSNDDLRTYLQAWGINPDA